MDGYTDVMCDDLCKAAAGSNGPVAVQIEHELNQVRSLMEGLSTQGSKLSETMQNMKPVVAESVRPTTAGGHFMMTN